MIKNSQGTFFLLMNPLFSVFSSFGNVYISLSIFSSFISIKVMIPSPLFSLLSSSL